MRNQLTEIIALYSGNIPKAEFEGTQKTITEGLKPLVDSGEEFRYTICAFGNTVGSGKPYKKITENSQKSSITAKELVCDKKSYAISLVDAATVLAQDVGVRYCGTAEIEIPGRIIFVIAVFGKDNASKQYTYESLREVVEHQTYVYKWEFYIITDEASNAERLGIPESNAVIVSTDSAGYLTPAVKEISDKIVQRVL
ncbi:MAG: hypothetical protein FWG83_03220 [Oscillospiraceae bacterium]|nr:hypothetical protein [Oscillospiraceae bacterium]